jgi:methylphosphotriester-DNA--protein-cysteine methyltransferase
VVFDPAIVEYHQPSCIYAQRCLSCITLNIEDASARGAKPCPRCGPDDSVASYGTAEKPKFKRKNSRSRTRPPARHDLFSQTIQPVIESLNRLDEQRDLIKNQIEDISEEEKILKKKLAKVLAEDEIFKAGFFEKFLGGFATQYRIVNQNRIRFAMQNNKANFIAKRLTSLGNRRRFLQDSLPGLERKIIDTRKDLLELQEKFYGKSPTDEEL